MAQDHDRSYCHFFCVTRTFLLILMFFHRAPWQRNTQINISLSALGQAVVAPQVCNKPREITETVLNPAPSMSGDTEPQERVDNKKANRRSTDATFPDLCGPPCEALTKPENILASRSSWCFVPHPGQQQLLNWTSADPKMSYWKWLF
ncbi:uncharacterized protein LOC143414520 [Maylandia zebra]|uniref:uncharacterized protein LOC143414520 n=1 Tax=Maylandia zebra TaxID=106582 RepID=UPI00403C4A9B